MQRKEILDPKDLQLVVDSIFESGNPVVYETYSSLDSDTLSFSNAKTLCGYLLIPRSRRDSFVGLSIYYPDAQGIIEKNRIDLDQRYCSGHTFRYETRGWGLIQFQVDLKDTSNIDCRVAVNSATKARTWSDIYPTLGSPDLWDWKVVEKHARRIIRTLRRHAQQPIGPGQP